MSWPTFEYRENGVHYKYWNCPIKFIPKNIFEFFMIFNYQKDFPSSKMPAFTELSVRFYMAYRFYENTLAECQKLYAEQSK